MGARLARCLLRRRRAGITATGKSLPADAAIEILHLLGSGTRLDLALGEKAELVVGCLFFLKILLEKRRAVGPTQLLGHRRRASHSVFSYS